MRVPQMTTRSPSATATVIAINTLLTKAFCGIDMISADVVFIECRRDAETTTSDVVPETGKRLLEHSRVVSFKLRIDFDQYYYLLSF